MNETLRGFGYAEYLEALVREIRRAMPTAATLVLWPDRPQLLRFLEEKATGLRSLLPDSGEYYSETRGTGAPADGLAGGRVVRGRP